MSCSQKCLITYVIINGIKYQKNSVITAKVNDVGIQFGIINKIFVVDSEIHFYYTTLYEICFDTHYFAYKVYNNNTQNFVKFNHLPNVSLNVLLKRGENFYVATKNRL